ncbi:MAG: hypothetical protein D6732_17580 [Methanobacteriota archaeon]|nr:MAG: hypothetical protein D6732_17580 [Euryarchaeota archaeon]
MLPNTKERASRILQEIIDLGAKFIVNPETMTISAFRISGVSEENREKVSQLKEQLKFLIEDIPNGDALLSMISCRIQNGICMKEGRTFRACKDGHYSWQPIFNEDCPCPECGKPTNTISFPSMSISEYREMIHEHVLSDNDIQKMMAIDGIAVQP